MNTKSHIPIPRIDALRASPLRHVLAAIGCATFAISAASAQDGTWTQPAGGTFDWSDTANWQDGDVANGTDANATFNVTPTGNQTATLDTAVTLGGLSLDWTSNNLTIAGPEALTLDVTSGTPIINVNSGRTLNLNTGLAGTDGLLFQGGGTLVLNGSADFGNNTLTGGVTIIGGTVNAAEVRANTIGNGPISISEGGSLLLRGSNNSSSQVFIGTGGGTMQNRGNNTYQTTGKLTGTGTLTFTTTSGGGARNWQFNSTENDFTGGFVLTNVNHALQVNSLGADNDITFNANAIFRYGSGAEANLTLGAIHLNGSGGRIRNDNSDHAITINSDLIATGGGEKTLELSSAGGPTNVFAGDIADATDGGEGTVALDVTGAGTWELQGANTYTGDTTISGGTLIFAAASQTLFAIGDSGINNAILGNGTANFDGTFVFDLTGASTILDDFWSVVDVENLNESYGANFSVLSTQGFFTENDGVWTISENNQVYQFSQDTGRLTVVPEPSTIALVGLAGLALLRRRRRA